jgi:hypothetical protein
VGIGISRRTADAHRGTNALYALAVSGISNGHRDCARHSFRTPIETHLTLELLNHSSHYASTEPLACRLPDGRSTSFGPAQDQRPILAGSPSNGNLATTIERQWTVFGGVGRQFVENDGDGLRYGWLNNSSGPSILMRVPSPRR